MKKNIGKLLADCRKIENNTCGFCGAAMRGIKTKKFCSGACRQKNYMRRKAADCSHRVSEITG